VSRYSQGEPPRLSPILEPLSSCKGSHPLQLPSDDVERVRDGVTDSWIFPLLLTAPSEDMDTPLEPAQTSSPQTSSSLPPIRYFNMLPPELLREVMDHLIPAKITEGNQGERRRTISSLCLTSKTFHRLARPALADALWLGTPHLTGILREKLEIWKNCRWLRLVMWDCDSAEKAVLEELVGGARLDDVALGTLPSIVPLVLTSSKLRYLSHLAI